MKQKLLALFLVMLLLICAMPVTLVAAAEPAPGRLLDYPLPGSLSSYRDVSGWIEKITCATPQEIEAWLNEKGMVRSDSVTNVSGSLSCHCCTDGGCEILISAADGRVTVPDCKICAWNVNYVLADAVGKLTLSVADAGFTVKDPNAALTLTAEDILSLFKGVTLTVGEITVAFPQTGSSVTVTGSYGGSGFTLEIPLLGGGNWQGVISLLGYSIRFVLDPVTEKLTPDFSAFGLLAGTVEFLWNRYLAGPFGAYLLDAVGAVDVLNFLNNFELSVKLSALDSFLDKLKYSGSVSFDVPYSFGYAFENLKNGTSAEINLAAVKADSWLNALDCTTGNKKVFLDSFLVDLISSQVQSGADHLEDMLSSSALVTGIWAHIVDTVGNFDLGLLGGQFGSLNLGNNAGIVLANFGELLKAKLTDEWLVVILENIGIQATFTSSFDPGVLKNLLVTNVTEVCLAVSEADSNKAMKVGETYTLPGLTAALADGVDTTYRYNVKDSAVVSVNNAGMVTALKAGVTTVEVFATVTDPKTGCAVPVIYNVEITATAVLPDTGDSGQVVVWAIMVGLSLAALVSALAFARRKKVN